MRFEDLCFLPVDRSAIIPDMLTDAERNWINEYHRQVYEKLSVFLNDSEKA